MSEPGCIAIGAYSQALAAHSIALGPHAETTKPYEFCFRYGEIDTLRTTMTAEEYFVISQLLKRAVAESDPVTSEEYDGVDKLLEELEEE